MANAVMMPRIGLNETENMLGEILVKEGDLVSEGDELFSVETDKSSLSVYAEYGGVILKIFYEDFDPVEVLTPVCVIGESGEDISDIEALVGGQAHKTTFVGESDIRSPKSDDSIDGEIENTTHDLETYEDRLIRISPRAKRLAESNGVDYSHVIPGGAENRIIEADILSIMSGTAKLRNEPLLKSEKFSKIRKIIADNMMTSLHSTAQLTHHCYFDAANLIKLKDQLKSEGKKSTIGDLIVFGLSRTLKEYPQINAHMVKDDEIMVFQDVHIGVAVDTERGLMVPTIKNAETLSLEQISDETRSLANECRTGAVSPEKLKDATFTISNLGNLGIQYFTPILNPPQVGILGIGTIDYKIRKTAKGMEFYPACYLSLTYDHRAIDGAPSSRFLNQLCKNLESLQDLMI